MFWEGCRTKLGPNPTLNTLNSACFPEETYVILSAKPGLANGNFAAGPAALHAIALPDEPSVGCMLDALNRALLENVRFADLLDVPFPLCRTLTSSSRCCAPPRSCCTWTPRCWAATLPT